MDTNIGARVCDSQNECYLNLDEMQNIDKHMGDDHIEIAKLWLVLT